MNFLLCPERRDEIEIPNQQMGTNENFKKIKKEERKRVLQAKTFYRTTRKAILKLNSKFLKFKLSVFVHLCEKKYKSTINS